MSQKKPLPLIALKDMVIFPHIMVPLSIGREKSLKAIEASNASKDKKIILVTQKTSTIENPTENDLYDVGVIAKIMQVVSDPNENGKELKILVTAQQRIKLTAIHDKEYLSASYELLGNDSISDLDELHLYSQKLLDKFLEYIKLDKKINPEIITTLKDEANDEFIINFISSNVKIALQKVQELLSIDDLVSKAKKLLAILTREVTNLETEQLVQNKVEQQLKKSHRDYLINEQIKILQKELGEDDKFDFSSYEKKMNELQLSSEAKDKVLSEIKKLKSMNPMSSETSVIRSYLDVILNLPWGKEKQGKIDLKIASQVLDKDHCGMEKVKERILEYLAVLKRAKQMQGPILCLVGPPGVGKTSLVKAIAEATNREYAKFSLGGVRDEAEIRGHRRTYLGSMPGKLISILKKVKTDNPVILLDEIDKMGFDYRGDPASALLEVLDPEQNKRFADHYLEVEYDLSKVLFIATSNSYDIPPALLDRLEVIKVPGYLETEKLSIAKKHLLPKLKQSHKVKENEFLITDDAILSTIQYYTRESGVRSLERELATVVRKALKSIIEGKEKTVSVETKDLETYLGVQRHQFNVAEVKDIIGTTTGLAYTESGGDLLSIEAVSMIGKGEVKATGKIGEVMRESTQTAYSCFKSQADKLNIPETAYKDRDVHLHFPAGAIPKDGPSAGIAIFTSIVSMMLQKPVKHDVAMTGEITLLGRVLPIGGLREKLLAALRGNIKTVIIPEANMRDLKEVPEDITKELKIIAVKTSDEVLKIALAN
ncbi:MAG: endopeptidase La [Rickettsiaceae bacterium]|nr:endopeptidase La [Rickettsiaceae bacterium]